MLLCKALKKYPTGDIVEASVERQVSQTALVVSMALPRSYFLVVLRISAILCNKRGKTIRS